MVGTSNKSVPEMASDCCLPIFSVVSLTEPNLGHEAHEIPCNLARC